MKIVVISASPRSNSQSLKVAKYLTSRLNTLSAEATTLDLHELKLPVYDASDSIPEGLAEAKSLLASSDGYVFVSPEWNGMASVALLNLMHYLEDNELAHKPVMLVGVSATRGGSYPVIQLRSLGYKNRHFIISPECLVVTTCKDVLNDDVQSDDAPDIYIKRRADYALKVLVEYAKALQNVRHSAVIDHKTYPNGM